MMTTSRLAATAVVLALLTCGLPRPEALAGERQDTPPAHDKGRDIYNFRCYFCHGYSGNAKTLAASYLDPQPLDFTGVAPDSLSRERMLKSVTDGRPGTGMQGFANILSDEEIRLVVDFIRDEFMTKQAENTRYHTRENGWDNHERYRIAYPFALGEIAIDTPWEDLTDEQQKGLRLFMTSCITCHDRARTIDHTLTWQTRTLSTPDNVFADPVDTTTGASIIAIHDIPPEIAGLSAQEKLGEALYQENCAFCHAADGTARNWIGSFLEPHPRNFTSDEEMATITWERMDMVIRKGLPDTTMSAWEHVLSEDQISAIIAYISRAFHPVEKTGKAIEPAPAQAPSLQWQRR